MTNQPAETAGKPARGYSWPPFTEGNTAAVKHGATSDRLVEPRARELVPQILEVNEHLDELRDGPGVYRYCVVLSRLERAYTWLQAQPDSVFSSDLQASRASKAPSPHGVWERVEKWESQADRAEERLGISPLARSRLGLDHQRGQLTAEEIEERKAARARLDKRLAALPKETE